MKYGIMFLEYKTYYRQPSILQDTIGGLDNHNIAGSGYSTEKGVEFETDCLETAKRIAIGFANFFTDTVFPMVDWEEWYCWLLVNKQNFPEIDETGFKQSEKSYKVKLINLDLFYSEREKQR